MFALLRETLRLFSQRSTYALIGAFLIHLTLGNKYTLSNVNTYMTSYMRKHGSPGATYGNSIWFSTCYSIGQPTSMVIGGYLERKFSTRLTCFLGCALYSISIMATSLSVDYGFMMALLTYGLLPGLGGGLAYMTPMSNGFGWFPERRGIVAGGILAGLGLGPFIFNMIQTSFVNPLNLSPPANENGYFTQDSILDRVPNMFLLMGCIYGLMELIGCSLLFEPPAELNQENIELATPNPSYTSDRPRASNSNSNSKQAKTNEDDQDTVSTICFAYSPREKEKERVQVRAATANDDGATPSTENNYENLIVKEAVWKREFIVLFLAFGFTTQGMLFVNSVLKKYGQTFIRDDNFLAWSGSVGSIANCLGRVVWGLAIDRLSFGACFISSSLLFCLACLLTPFQFILSSKVMFLLVTIGFFGSLSGWVCIFPVHISRVFGRANASIIYGFVYLSQPAISVLISPAVQYLVDNTNRFFPFYFILASNCLGLLIYLAAYPKPSKREPGAPDLDLDVHN